MAIIGKIREKSVLLVVIIGLALLAFILGDYQKGSSGSDDFIGSGTVFGERIDEVKFEAMVQQFKNNDAQQAEKDKRPYDQAAQDQSANQAWNYFTMSAVLEKEYEDLGIEVSPAEFDAYLYGTNGFSVLPNLASQFVDPATGVFSAKLLQKTIDGLKNSKKPEEQKSWADNKESFLSQRKEQKYFAILHQGVYVTKLEAEQEYLAQNEVKSVSFVVRRYSEIDDEKIKVSDEELKAYYEEHKNEKKYENKKSSRDVKYFDVKLIPSKKDSADFNKELNEIKAGFATAKNDSLYVMGYSKSNVKFYSTARQYTCKPEGHAKAQQGLTYPMSMDTVFKTASIGQIVGPYNDNGNVRVAKIIDFNTKVCKVRHILINAEKGDAKKIAKAQSKADSIVKLLTKDNFAEMVMKYSDDGGSKEKGGVYEDFMDGEMVPEFSKFSTDMPIGTIGTVKTQFGIHIIEVLDRKEVKYPVLAFIEKTLVPSETTSNDIETKAYNLLLKLDAKISAIEDNVKKGEMFDTIATKAKCNPSIISIEENKPVFNTRINTSMAEDKILAVAYGAESVVGTLCPVVIKDKDRFIIAMLSAIHAKGAPSFEDVSAKMKAELIKDKKATQLIAQMVKKSLDVCAKKGNTKIEKAEVNFANPSMGSAGPEPEIVGVLFSGLKKGVRSIPIKGDAGVYVVRIDNNKKAPAAIKYDVEVKKMLTALKSSVDGAIRMSMMNRADVVDNRLFSRAGVRQ